MVTTRSITAAMHEARDRGVASLLAHQRDDGAVGNPKREGCGPYYKAIWALAAGGRSGVQRAAELLRHELALALPLLGCGSVDQVSRELLAPD